MPIENYWVIPDQIKFVKYIDAVTLDDLARIANHNIKHLTQPDRTTQFHIINDLTQSTSNPSFLEAKKYSDMVAEHKHFGWTIIINDMNAFMRFTVTMVLQVTQLKYKMVSNMEDAIEFLKTVDSTLPDHITDHYEPIE